MSAGAARKRKSMAALASAVGKLSDNWIVNRETLVDKAKVLVPFPGVEWDGTVWDVSLAYLHRTRGYKADQPAQRLLFTQHSLIQPGTSAGPFKILPTPQGSCLIRC